MRFQRSMAAWASIVLLVMAADVRAQNGRGGTPNGKPFQQMQSQLAEVNAELAALDARVRAIEAHVAGIESGLQAQIDLLNTNLGALQSQVTSVQSAAAALEATMASNTAAIGALETAVADLRVALQNATDAIAANAGDVQALTAQVAGITALINTHTSQIASLRQQNVSIDQFLANLANGSCQAGQAVTDITSGGFISCSTMGSAGGNLATHSKVVMGPLGFGSNTLIVTCQAGYALASSGYSAPSNYEGFAYLKPGGASGVSYKSPVSVTANFAFNGTAMVTVSYTPELFFAGTTWAAVAHCVKVS